MIREEICTYEVCKLAKEKGFDVQTFDWYDYTGNYSKGFIPHKLHECPRYKEYYAPSQSLLQRWLREEKNIVFGISPMQEMDCDYLGWCATIYKVDDDGYGLSWQEELYYDTYELALENALKYSLENLV